MHFHPDHACLRWSVLLMLAACAFQARAGDRYSTVYNRSHQAIRAMQVRQAGSDTWTDVDVGAGIAGKTSRTLHLRSAGRGRCLYDIKTTFEGRPSLLHERMDLCAVWTYDPESYRQLGIQLARDAKPPQLAHTTQPARPATLAYWSNR